MTDRSKILTDFMTGQLTREGPYVAIAPWLLYDQIDIGMLELPPLRLYEKLSSGAIVPFLEAGVPASPLMLSQHDPIFFEEKDLPSVRTYVEALFLTRSHLIRDLPIAQQTKLIRNAAIQVVDDIFLDPSPENLKRGTQVVSSMVYTLMREPEAYSLMSSLSSHDPYTLQHSVGTAIQAIILAKRMGLASEEQLMEAGIAGLFHDLGKIKVRPEVINKRGPLSELEWLEMRTHSLEGYRLVEHNPDIPAGAKRAILEHHEDQHGTGYPNQKKLSELPLLSRIVAVADIFNALTTHRSYSPAMTVFDALQLMSKQMAHKMDPDVFKELVVLHRASTSA